MKSMVGVLIAAMLVLALAAPASATWSIVGVDPDSGEVGVAVASCVSISALDTDGRFELVALVAGKGAGISQAAYNAEVPPVMEQMLASNSTGSDIINAVTNPDFDSDPQNRQHGMVLLSGEAIGFTGDKNSDFAGDLQGLNVSAQGNILLSDQVIIDAVANFEASAGRPLADRLVDALEAGSLAGGDSRCGEQTALFAHVSVIDENGNSADPNVLSLTNWADDGDGINPVTQMAENYRAGLSVSKPPQPPANILLSLALLLVPVLAIGALGFFAITKFRRR